MKYLLLPLLFLSGCAFQAGVSFHSENGDAPEVTGMDNPIGILRGVYRQDNGEFFCEHLSSIPVWEQGYGFNHCGYVYEF